MKRLFTICLTAALAAGLLAACGRKPVETPAQAPVVERASPIAWTGSGFTVKGKPLKTAKLWTFEGSTDGFSSHATKLTPAVGGGLAVEVIDAPIRSPTGLNVLGRDYPIVLVRLTRTGEGQIWDSALYYSTLPNGEEPMHGEDANFFGKPIQGAEPKVGETTTMIYDMRNAVAGGDAWTKSLIDQIRLDLEDAPGGTFVIHQIAIAEPINPSLIPADPKKKKNRRPASDPSDS